ncbi:hypothetical protein HPB48_021981 [Haemaphysalis longicornis]|uniref:RING-type domain-containing protein n=1 Tax=Haemaphysalis longicornis TaxID=44386 RepID=A0A9J6FP85_HAELO|nr:hypothetical protein HPB48_021981 [Haemaphysalis longicornis]
MPASIYTLCGFASGVDFRPIKFKECLPQVRICCLCGIVPDKMALLPCSHQLCESCLQGCVDADGSVCPIDKELFLVEGEVSWITPSRRHLSKMQVSARAPRRQDICVEIVAESSCDVIIHMYFLAQRQKGSFQYRIYHDCNEHVFSL